MHLIIANSFQKPAHTMMIMIMEYKW